MNTKLSIFVVLLCLVPLYARATDTDGCLTCHRYPGLSMLSDDKRTLRQFHVEPSYFSADGVGPHARLRCTDCHNEAEVQVFPHRNVGAVDCARACHLDSRDSEIRYSHGAMRDALQGSVHTTSVLEKANSLIGSPLRPGQSMCLLCHEERSLMAGGNAGAQNNASLDRCGSCHTGSASQSPQSSFRHMTSRFQPARSRQEVMAACVPCHSDARVRAEFHLPDAVASYFWSFHGKAMLLGNQNTAVCLDCHVRSRQNAHLILAKSNPQSSINPSHAPDTCRSAACHPYVEATMASAAIHLDLPTNHGLEQMVAAIFVLLILFTFGPSLMICVLKLVHGAFARPDPEEHRRAELARRILATPEGRRLLERFSFVERLQHWLLAICFIALVLTGFPIKFADAAWAQWLIDRIGGLSAARILHRGGGVLLLLGLVVHLVYLASRLVAARRREGKSLKQALLGLPMIPQLADQKFMLDLVLHLLFIRRHAPQAHRFNPEQKFEYLGVFWGTIVLGGTGLLMWNNNWTASHLSGRILTFAALIHTFEAFLALLHVGIVHIVGVIFSPQVFPISRAMFNGVTPPTGLAEAHAHLIEDVRRQLEAEHPELAAPHRRGIFRRIAVGAYSLGVAAVVAALGVIAFASMLRTAFLSTPVAAQLSQWPMPMPASAIRDAAVVPGLSALAESEPLGHYHHIEPWYRLDKVNGCSTVGCHEPLPHSSKVKTAAFNNAHTQFLACEMCHGTEAAQAAPAQPVWINTIDGSLAGVPAAVRLGRFLEVNHGKIADAPADVNAELRYLVGELVLTVPANAPLNDIMRQLDAASAGSPVWRCAVDQLRDELPSLGHGDRVAKLARQTTPDEYRQQMATLIEQGREYQQATPGRKEELKTSAHSGLLKSPVQCISCHRQGPEGLAFEKIGYSPATAAAMSKLPVAKLMDGIRQGQEFHIPRMLKGPAEGQGK